MRGYELACPDGGVETIEASSYQVDDSGGIEFKLGGRTVLSRKSGRWVGVQEFGNRLTTEWPTPKLDSVLQGLMHHLAVTLGYYVHRVGPAHKYDSQAFNDLDALTSAILTDTGIDPHTTDDKRIVNYVREIVGAAFEVDIPEDKVRPSSVVTALHCPRCGHSLWADTGELRCPGSPVTFSRDAIQALTDYCASPPADAMDQATASVWEDTQFCPDDGARLTDGVGVLPHCFSCHRVLRSELIRQLAERHGPYAP